MKLKTKLMSYELWCRFNDLDPANLDSNYSKYLDWKNEQCKPKWIDTQFLYCYECIYPIHTAKAKENNGVWECDECGTTNNINEGDKQCNLTNQR